MKGRKPKTAAQRAADGDTHKQGRKRFAESIATAVKMPDSAPEMPPFLDEIARKEWDRLVPILAAGRVLTAADGLVLAQMCQAYSRLVQAERLLSEYGMLQVDRQATEGAGPRFSISPILRIIQDANLLILRCAQEFGMTAVSRSRIRGTADTKQAVPSVAADALTRLSTRIKAKPARRLKYLH